MTSSSRARRGPGAHTLEKEGKIGTIWALTAYRQGELARERAAAAMGNLTDALNVPSHTANISPGDQLDKAENRPVK